jgi:hypothetical protein
MPVMALYISGNITALITPIFFATIEEGMQYVTNWRIAPSSANVDFISKAGTPSREFLADILL